MKKNTIAIILLLASLTNNFFAQAGTDFNKNVDNINKMFPAAPTSNNLMKFEEVPVSYYTGIPDISIPLFNIPTSSPNVNLNVQLKYHPLSAKPDDKAGETGLGWNLLAGGTITRTVRGGGPDERVSSTLMSLSPTTKYGIYMHNMNPTYKLFNNLTDFDAKEYAFYAGIGKYDTEYDLYQYNFMGYTGRFMIKKDPNGNFIIEKMDRNNLIITSTHSSAGEPLSIIITDDNGIQYSFTGMEYSTKGSTTVKMGIINSTGEVLSSSIPVACTTSYHLEKISDQQNNLLMLFTYAQNSTVEYSDPEEKTSRFVTDVQYDNLAPSSPQINPDTSLPGKFETQIVRNTSSTRLVTDISITDIGSIHFTYEKGRNDSNYSNSAELYKLKSVQSNSIGQSSNQYVDKYIFDYDYSTSLISKPFGPAENLKKLLLKKITKVNMQNQNDYSFTYTNNNKLFEKDKWKYYKGDQPVDIAQDVLSSITYPTKGKAIFDFGENVYSYAAGLNDTVMEPITGEWVDIGFNYDLSGLNSFSSTAKAQFFILHSPQKVILQLGLGNLLYSRWDFKIYKKNADNTFSAPVYTKQMDYQSCIQTSGAACPNRELGEGGEPITEINDETYELEPGIYYASLEGEHGPTHRPVSYAFTAFTKEHFFNSYLTKKGGGLRINSIKYFDTPTSPTAAKELVYDYSDIDNPQKSSGALVFPEPIFKYNETINYNHITVAPEMIYYNALCTTTTDFNILPSEKTQGSDVGYQYVTIRQIVKDINNAITDNGKTIYKFRSPIEFPNPDTFLSTMPINPIPNKDYLRGQMMFEKKYDANGRILTEINNAYTTLEFTKLDGIKIKDNYYNYVSPNLYIYKQYEAFVTYNPTTILTTPYKYYLKYGVTLPVEKRETSYFYKDGVQSSVVSTTNTVYNTEDYPSSVTQTSPDGITNVSSYKYAKEKSNQRLTAAHMIAIPLEKELKQNGKVLSKSEIKYDNTNNLFPSSILAYDLQNNPFTEVIYDKYDNKGNLLQYTTKEGIPVIIVWGYNQTKPIMKITGITYSHLLQNYPETSDIISASNTDASKEINNDETVLLSLLQALRIKLNIDRFRPQVTTYTYDPLVGVRSITPPSGIKESYLYDSAGRLEKVINADGKVLKEMKYNYKN